MNRITVEEEEEQEDGNWKVLLQNGDEWEDQSEVYYKWIRSNAVMSMKLSVDEKKEVG